MEESVNYGFTLLPSPKNSVIGGDPDSPIKKKLDSLQIDLTEEVPSPEVGIWYNG